MTNAEAWLKSIEAKQLAVAKGFKAQMAWLSSSEAKQRGAAAKAHAISEFKKRFLHADICRFQVQVDFDTNRKATGEVLFPESDGSLTDPPIADRKYWSQPLQVALQIHQDGGFPLQLSLTRQTKPQMPIPAVDFSEETQSSIDDAFNKELKIYVTPTEFFTTKFRKIFTDTDHIHNLKIVVDDKAFLEHHQKSPVFHTKLSPNFQHISTTNFFPKFNRFK